VVTIQAPSVSLRVPYQYLVGTGVIDNFIPLIGDGFDGTVGQTIPDGAIAFKLVDATGLPVVGQRVAFSVTTGGSGAAITNADTVTDQYGIAQAKPVLGSVPGNYGFTASAGRGWTYEFTGAARALPVLYANSVANAASFDNTKPVAPGSYIAISGTALSDYTDPATAVPLPLAIDYVSVSFDVPSAGISVPARLLYVSPGQINAQVPWELQGQSSAQMKVTIDFTYSNVITVPIANYSPALFQAAAGQAAALDKNFQLIGPSHPVNRGDVVILYANGLGPTKNQPASGDPAPSAPSLATTPLPVVMIGGQSAAVAFSGLVPGYPGLYQINATVPTGIPAGNQTLTVAIGGATSPTSGLVVQ
jgi:uncharacterized protein (TIGR03437 family)